MCYVWMLLLLLWTHKGQAEEVRTFQIVNNLLLTMLTSQGTTNVGGWVATSGTDGNSTVSGSTTDS